MQVWRRRLGYAAVISILAGLAVLAGAWADNDFKTQVMAAFGQQSAAPGGNSLPNPQTTTETPKPASGPRGKADARPVAVEVSEARAAKATDDIRAIGSLLSDESVVLAPEVAGRVSEIMFSEGEPVKKGDKLVQLDDALVAAEVADAKARLSLASANTERARQLTKSGNVTLRGRDEAVSNFETAQAALDLAQTKLGKLTLVAPFDGVAGLRGVSVGAFVSAGAPLVNLEKIDTLKVDFKVPEIHLQAIKVGQKIDVQVDAFPDRAFSGEIYAINPLVDVNGRALQIRARLDNKDQMLRPGLFARIVIKGLQERETVFVPEAAIVPRGEETFVFVVSEGKAVETRVTLGLREKAQVEIVDGISAKMRVVTAGQLNLRNGAAVEVLPGADPQSQSGSADDASVKRARSRG